MGAGFDAKAHFAWTGEPMWLIGRGPGLVLGDGPDRPVRGAT